MTEVWLENTIHCSVSLLKLYKKKEKKNIEQEAMRYKYTYKNKLQKINLQTSFLKCEFCSSLPRYCKFVDHFFNANLNIFVDVRQSQAS